MDDTTIGANLSWRWAVELDLLVQRDGRVVAELEQNVATMDVCISSKRGKSAKTSSDMRCRCHVSGWRSQLTAVNDLGMSMKVVEGVKNRLGDHHDNRLAEQSVLQLKLQSSHAEAQGQQNKDVVRAFWSKHLEAAFRDPNGESATMSTLRHKATAGQVIVAVELGARLAMDIDLERDVSMLSRTGGGPLIKWSANPYVRDTNL